MSAVIAPAAAGNADDPTYDALLARVQARWARITNAGKEPVFTVQLAADADPWQLYLSSLPAERRQHYNCSCCKAFIRRYGTLATIDPDTGALELVFWNGYDATEAGTDHPSAFGILALAIANGRATGIFHDAAKVWGTPQTGIWRHFAVATLGQRTWENRLLTAKQAMAARREAISTVRQALLEYPEPILADAIRILEAEAVSRAEKVIGPAKFLFDLHQRLAKVKGREREHVLLRAVGPAPEGFLHPRSSMISTLLDDLNSGIAFDAVQRRWNAKMHPLAYQRPQAAPSSGTIRQAEEAFEKLGLFPALRRRYARLEDCETIWTPTPPKTDPGRGGLFAHLDPDRKPKESVTLPERTMTWSRFRDELLPKIERIEAMAPSVGPYTAFLTAADPDAPPIIRWDREPARNPVSWYFNNPPAKAAQYNLISGDWVPVTAITMRPDRWRGHAGPHQFSEGLFLLLKGARDTRPFGLALFPEILLGELHQFRAVIEAHSNSQAPEGADEATAAGLGFADEPGRAWGIRLRCWDGSGWQHIGLDRWA